MKKRYVHLDILRILATFLVMWQHFVGTGTYEGTIILGIIEDAGSLPLIPEHTHSLNLLEAYMYKYLNTQPAIIGVLIFFLISGYLTAKTMDTKSRKEFILNRFFRIFPVLFIAIVLAGVLGYAIHGMTFSTKEYITSLTMIYACFGINAIIAVMWTLQIEIYFYICIVILGRLNVYKLLLLEAITFLLVVFTARYEKNILINFAFSFKFVSFMLIGVSVYLAEKIERRSDKILLIGSTILASYACFGIHNLWFGDTQLYYRFSTFLIVLGLFFAGYFWNIFSPVLSDKIPSGVQFLSKISYCIYLTHTVVGFNIMYILSKWNVNAYLNVFFAFAGSIAVGAFICYGFEQPCVKIGNRIIAKVNEREKYENG